MVLRLQARFVRGGPGTALRLTPLRAVAAFSVWRAAADGVECGCVEALVGV